MSLARRLISAGFSDLEKGERFLAAPELEGIDQDVLFAGLQLAASPDAALQSLTPTPVNPFTGSWEPAKLWASSSSGTRNTWKPSTSRSARNPSRRRLTSCARGC